MGRTVNCRVFFFLTQHSIIPVFQYSFNPRIILLDSEFWLLTFKFAIRNQKFKIALCSMPYAGTE